MIACSHWVSHHTLKGEMDQNINQPIKPLYNFNFGYMKVNFPLKLNFLSLFLLYILDNKDGSLAHSFIIISLSSSFVYQYLKKSQIKVSVVYQTWEAILLSQNYILQVSIIILKNMFENFFENVFKFKPVFKVQGFQCFYWLWFFYTTYLF